MSFLSCDNEKYESDPAGEPGLQPDNFIKTSKVIGLDPKSYKLFVKNHNATLIMFYDPTNRECHSTAKHFAKVAKKFKEPTHAFGAVNCYNHPHLCCMENISAYPYFKIFSWGVPYGNFFYSNQYQYQDMKKWMQGVPKSGKGYSGESQSDDEIPEQKESRSDVPKRVHPYEEIEEVRESRSAVPKRVHPYEEIDEVRESRSAVPKRFHPYEEIEEVRESRSAVPKRFHHYEEIDEVRESRSAVPKRFHPYEEVREFNTSKMGNEKCDTTSDSTHGAKWA